MQVILKQDVKKLGKTGDLVKVAEGYARNFLIPRGFAEEANAGNIKQLKHQEKIEQRKKAREEEGARETAAKLDGLEVTVRAKTGGAGKLFGSITAADVADGVKKAVGVEVDKRKIELPDPIKNLGNYHLEVKIHPDISATLHVVVAAE